ncbi:MAG: AAA family ATPase [Rhodanobacteraceae bacterium]
MSIVEKAAERLKTLQPEPVLPSEEPVPQPTGPTIERLHERRVRTVDEADAAEAAPALHIDLHALRRAGLLPADDDAGARLADEVRRVKRPLLDNAYGKSGKALAHAERISVTSAVPGEGKTFTAMNLALSLAREPDFEVLLVDGDIPKMDITRVLGLEERPGLMDALTGACRPDDVVVTTDVPNLLVIPAGQRSAVTTELFGGRRMEYVLERLGGDGRQRLLVFDSSPLLATPESQVLAAHMGQVVIVVSAGHTREHELKAALECMHDAQYVGLLLNMSRLPAIENHYYRHYGEFGYTPQYQLRDH